MQMRKYQRGDALGDAVKAGFIFIAVVVAVVVAIGACFGVWFFGSKKNDTKLLAETAIFSDRADDLLKSKSLTVITMEKFSKNAACPADITYGAKFVAKDTANKVVEGRICMATNREAKLIVQ
jgi:hypothetical protein